MFCTFPTIDSERDEPNGLACVSKTAAIGTEGARLFGTVGRWVSVAKIAERIRVSKAETAKILQLLVWGGFVTSRRGTKGGFHLSASADQITMGEVIDFLLSRHPARTGRRFRRDACS